MGGVDRTKKITVLSFNRESQLRTTKWGCVRGRHRGRNNDVRWLRHRRRWWHKIGGMECDGCQSVRYCCDKCREEHLEQHGEECKKRKAELHDRMLFTQPAGSHLGECPICFLPLSLDPLKSRIFSCCCAMICDGCLLAYNKSNGDRRCLLCWEPALSDDDEEDYKRMMERVKANDPAALRYMGSTLRWRGLRCCIWILHKGSWIGWCRSALSFRIYVSL